VTARCNVARQRGMASLIVALVLMMSMTLFTLSAARTQLAETRMAGNEHGQARLRLLAESAWEKAVPPLTLQPPRLRWRPDTAAGGSLLSETTPAGAASGFDTLVQYRRANADSPVIDIEAIVRRAGDHALSGRVGRSLRLLTVLSPLAETAPPLVIAGCLSASAAVDIRPLNSDNAKAGDAVWRFGAARCGWPATVDLHAGGVVDKPPAGDLWTKVFSVSRRAYARLAAAERALAPGRRRYWLAGTAGAGAPWRLSLGSARRPVVLVFPAAAGCPRFAAAVRIYGVVFIDADCNRPLATAGLEITGSLAVNGGVDAGDARLRLNHIHTADPAQARLALPVLRTVNIPGSWRDY
jgi:PilX N-terminal